MGIYSAVIFCGLIAWIVAFEIWSFRYFKRILKKLSGVSHRFDQFRLETMLIFGSIRRQTDNAQIQELCEKCIKEIRSEMEKELSEMATELKLKPKGETKK